MSDDSDHSADSDSGGGGGDGDVFLQRLQEREYSHDDVDSDINENVTRTEGNGSSDKQNQRVAGRGEEGALWSSKQRQHRSRSEGHSGGRGLPTAHACEEDGEQRRHAATGEYQQQHWRGFIARRRVGSLGGEVAHLHRGRAEVRQ